MLTLYNRQYEHTSDFYKYSKMSIYYEFKIILKKIVSFISNVFSTNYYCIYDLNSTPKRNKISFDYV